MHRLGYLTWTWKTALSIFRSLSVCLFCSEAGPSQISHLSRGYPGTAEGGCRWRSPALSARTHPSEAPNTRQALRPPAAAQPGPGKREGWWEGGGKARPGSGVPAKQDCADVTERAIWLERFKKGASERRCCCTQLRPPAATQRSPPLRRLQRGGLQRPAWPQLPERSPRSNDPADARLTADALWGCRLPVSCRSR